MESSAPPVQDKPARPNLLSSLLDNPVIAKELKGRMRGRQGFILLSSYLALISFFIGLVYLFLSVDGSLSAGDPGYLQVVGKVIFSTVVLLELLMVSFIGPALTSGAISSERERQTFDLLRTSLLSGSALVFGKLSSAVVFLLLLIFTAIPVQSMSFFLGGVGMAEMAISILMLVVSVFFFSALGLFFSSFTNRTLVSTVSSYAAIMLSFIVQVLIFILLIVFTGILDSSNIFQTSVTENIMNVTTWFLFSTNPLFAAVVSEAILISDQSLFMTSSGMFGTMSFPLPSPWIIYTAFHAIMTALLIALSIRFVNRPDR